MSVPISGFGKLFVLGGVTENGRTPDAEIIDISGSDICSQYADFPFPVESAVGFFNFKNRPVICAGNNGDNIDGCYEYKNEEWTQSYKLINLKSNAAAVVVSHRKALIFGGYLNPDRLDSVEVLTENGFEDFKLNLPEKLSSLCALMLNPNKVMVIGGNIGKFVGSPKTFILDIDKKEWSEGPELNHGRYYHSCACLKNQGEVRGVVVAGGWNSTRLRSVEILNLEENVWRLGPGTNFIKLFKYSTCVRNLLLTV